LEQKANLLYLLPIMKSSHNFLGIRLITANLDKVSRFTNQDLWIDCKRWELHYLDRYWAEESLVDEEEPLLGFRSIATKNSGWWWKKWILNH